MRRFLRASLPVLALLLCAGAASAAEAGGAPAHVKPSLLDMVWHGMPIMGVLIILSLIAYGLALQYVFTIKREALIPPGLADEIHNLFAEGVTDEAVENSRNVVASDPSMLGTILAAVLDKKDFGYDAMREAAEQAGQVEHNKYSSRVAWLSMFASSATLLGLLGTVTGIIGAFLNMGPSVDPGELAKNIGEALICTASGLGIAIGMLYFFFWLRNRVNACALEAALITQEILDYFRSR
jgi:biopolymer transport protein ExbB